MALLTSVSPSAAPSGGFRQVLAVVDLDTPVEPVVRRAVAESLLRDIPLQVVVLHPPHPFTTDPAVAARAARRLSQQQQRVVADVVAAARDSGWGEPTVRLVPLRRSLLRGDGGGPSARWPPSCIASRPACSWRRSSTRLMPRRPRPP